MVFVSVALLPAALAVLCQTTFVLASVQQVLTSGDAGKALPTDIIETIQSIVDAHDVPGLSIAFVRPGGSVEYGNWGVRSEDGDAMTSDVRLATSKCVLEGHD